MKIIELRSFVVYGGLQNWVLVELVTDAGIVGVGEASIGWLDRSVAEALQWLGRYVVGQDPFDIERLWLKLYMRSPEAAKISVPGRSPSSTARSPDRCCCSGSRPRRR